MPSVELLRNFGMVCTEQEIPTRGSHALAVHWTSAVITPRPCTSPTQIKTPNPGIRSEKGRDDDVAEKERQKNKGYSAAGGRSRVCSDLCSENESELY